MMMLQVYVKLYSMLAISLAHDCIIFSDVWVLNSIDICTFKMY